MVRFIVQNCLRILRTIVLPILASVVIIVPSVGLSAEPSWNMQVMGLNGEWQFRQVGQDRWYRAEVPGTVHEDLMLNGLLPDPFSRDNELRVQWVENADWEYRRTFNVPTDFETKGYIELVFDGLDTFATVFLNGTKLGAANNMFRTWRFDVKPLVKKGANELRVVFDSPVRRENLLEQNLTYKIPGNAPHARKAPYSFGWDWGPRLATSGIWKLVSLEVWDEVRCTDIRIAQDHSKKGEVALTVTSEFLSDQAMKADLELSFDGGKPVARRAVTLAPGLSQHETRVVIKNPKLWWPSGMGDQNLYVVHASLSQSGRHLAAATRRIGLRTLELIQDKDAWGTSFYFRVNGVPFFAKGGNWIPPDSFLPRVYRDRYENLLKSCQNAHMNMLRVWGGGVYESEDFYDLCDELGLVVWQDFMFACQMVPGDAAFLDNVRAEAEEVVKSLRHHACLGLWCGNNECEEGWFFWGWKQSLPASVWDDYQKVFDGILPEAVRQFDPGRPYWPSSPHTLNKTGDPRSEEAGDMHYWGVWHGQEPFEEYQKHNHRFYSEYGFQSFPLLDTVKSYTTADDRNITSPVMEQHQKHPEGNRLILLYMLDWFRLPKDFESLLWTSEVLQAEGMKIAVEHHRSQMPRIMGSLYWQVNDCWPVASWAGMDYYGNWKALHYYARRFYNPVLITAISRGDKLVVSAVSDYRRPEQMEYRWSVRTYRGETLKEESRPATIEPGRSAVLMEAPLEELRNKRSADDVYFACELAKGDKVYSSNIYHFSRLKRVALPDPAFSTSVTVDCCAPVVEVKAKYFAKDVFLEAPGCPGRFEDNFFDMLPGRTYKVRFLPEEGASIDLLKSRLTIRSLKDTY